MRYLRLLLLTAASSWGCSCISLTSPCSEVGGSSVIFVARVLTDSGEGWGKGPARVAIEEPLQNVPKGQTEADIDTAAGTSCYVRLKAGERYVIITNGPHYSVMSCSSSFRLTGKEHILDAMRSQIKGGAPTLVGTVAKRTGAYSRAGGIPGVTITIEADGKKREGVTDGSGHFSFPNLDPARYRIQYTKQGYSPDPEYIQEWSSHLILNEAKQEVPGTVLVAKNSCTVWDLGMWPDGRIRGLVRSRGGTPLGGVTVQAFAFDKESKRESSPLAKATTAADGSYTVRPLPPGSYVIGINGDEYKDEDVYPPTFYAGGKALYVGESAAVSGADITLPAPRLSAQLKVRVVRKDGSAYQGATIRLDNLEGTQRWFTKDETDAKGEITLPAYVGESYTIRAFDYVSDLKNKKSTSFEGTTRIEVLDRRPSAVVVVQER